MITGLKSRISVPQLIVFNETIATMGEKDIKEGKDCKVQDKHYAMVRDESTY